MMRARARMRVRTRIRRRGRGVTLVEMVTAIGIVVFLVGATMSAIGAVGRRMEVHRAADTLRLLDMALQEWEVAADRKLTWGDDPDLYDVWSQRAHPLIITEILDVIGRCDPARDVIARIDPELVHRYEAGAIPPWLAHNYAALNQLDDFVGGLAVLDPWGTPIYPTHPGPPAPAGETADDADGTMRTVNEEMYGIALGRRVCFVSAGPDRRFGIRWEFLHLSGEERERAMAEAQRDNVYSYLPIVPSEIEAENEGAGGGGDPPG